MDEARITEVTTAAEWRAAAALMREYVDGLPFALDFQNFERELAELDREYGPPQGCALLVWHDGTPVGVAGLRPLDAGVAELKRMYLRPEARGRGTGRRLGEALVAAARRLGYQRIRLDTDAELMPGAVALYRSLGFRDIPAYRHNPLPGACFLELRLEDVEADQR